MSDVHAGGTKEKRSLRRLWADFAGELFVEAVLALAACLLFAAVSAAAIWGYARAPLATSALGVAMVALLTNGLGTLIGKRAHPRGRLATVAVASCVLVGIWASYVLQYYGHLQN